MSMDIKIGQNTGIISTGNDAHNTIIHNSPKKPEINWEELRNEIELLKTNPDASIRKFAEEAEGAVKKKDTGKIKAWLLKWIPCIGGLIESSYYILETAKIFGITK